MKKRNILDKNKEKDKSVSGTDIKDRKSTKSQSEIEKELEIRSYNEYKIKDDISINQYEDENIEDKLIRLVNIKKKGGNVKENLNLIKKNNKKKASSKLSKIKKALLVLDKLNIQHQKRNIFRKLKSKGISPYTKKITLIFLQKFKKYIIKVYLKAFYNNIIVYLLSILTKKKFIKIKKN